MFKLGGGGWDFMVSIFTIDGTHLWTVLFGTGSDDNSIGGVTNDAAGNVYFTCSFIASTFSLPKIGNYDTIFGKLSSTGQLLWVQVLGTSGQTYTSSRPIFVEEQQSLYFVINSGGTFFDGTTSLGVKDNLLVRATEHGEIIWTMRIGSANDEGVGTLVYVPKHDCVAVASTANKSQ